MKIDLVELKINEDNYYKYKSFKYCCAKIRDNPCIVFTNEDTIEEDNDSSVWNIPKFCIREEMMEDDWEDTFQYTNNFPINFCPFCGEKIEISIAEELDVSEKFNELSEKHKKLRDESRRTDSRRKARKLEDESIELGRKIDGFYILSEWKEESDE